MIPTHFYNHFKKTSKVVVTRDMDSGLINITISVVESYRFDYLSEIYHSHLILWCTQQHSLMYQFIMRDVNSLFYSVNRFWLLWF